MTQLTQPDEPLPDLTEMRKDTAGGETSSSSILTAQYRILKAIVLRNLTKEWGDSRIGHVISIFLPVVTIAVLIVMFGLRGKVIQSAFPLATFVITGYPLWNGFSGMYNKIIRSSSRTDSLLMFPQITQLDIIYADAIVFAATQTVVFAVLCVGDVVLIHSPAPENPLGVILCFWACIWIGFGVGLILSPIQRIFPVAVSILNMFLRLGMWISGVVFSVDHLPTGIQPYLRWNPILHCIEGSRALWNPDAGSAPIFSPSYIILSGFVLMTVGLLTERLSRRFVH